MLRRNLAWLAVCAALTVAFATAGASPPNPLRERLLRSDDVEAAAAWFARADTNAFFLLDRTQELALLRERDDPAAEVLVLEERRGPGGATSYVTDTGREIVRITTLGGATYFPPDRRNGVIAEYAAPASALIPPARTAQEVRSRAETMAQRLAAAIGRDIALAYDPAPRGELGALHDALGVVEAGLMRALGEVPRRVRSIEQIDVVNGPVPGVMRDGATLVVTINTAAGYAGRPSSARIAAEVIGAR